MYPSLSKAKEAISKVGEMISTKKLNLNNNNKNKKRKPSNFKNAPKKD